MPKDEFDFEDPFELNGMAFLTLEDSTDDMARTFIEEFMRMGYGHKQILALFRNPQYLGPTMAYAKRGEPFVRDLITEVFASWGRLVEWGNPGPGGPAETPASPATVAQPALAIGSDTSPTLTDPMGSPIPTINL
jgi:hypothetical protein